MRRSRIPVRLTIHSSLVSSIVDRSWLLRTAGGRHLPQPVIAACVTERSAATGLVRIAGGGSNRERAAPDRLLALAPASLARPRSRCGRAAGRERLHRDNALRSHEVRGRQGERLPARRSSAAHLLATARALRLRA